MELAVSAITGDLASRFMSFLMNKYANRVCSEEKVKRLQQLLVRIHTVVEEADMRRITSSLMLTQLRTLAAAMYQGYHVLDTINHRRPKEPVSNSSALSLFAPLKLPHKIGMVFNLEIQRALQDLENVVANMTEFVLLFLGGCERIPARLYDTCFYVDSFMFGRHAEKQQLINFLLQEDTPGGRPPTVLPVIGGHGVGKKTLVAHVCNDQRVVHSHFSSILHLNGDDIFRVAEHEKPSGRALVVVEFVSEVADDEWTTFFYSYVTCIGRGTKVIILCRNKNFEKFGTAKPIYLRCLAYQEYRYLFKALAFGTSDPLDYPQLAQIVEEFPMHLGGSLISANLLADALRKNLNLRFWLCKLNRIRASVRKNMPIFGLHPQVLFYRGHPVHFVLSPLQESPDVPRNDLPKMILGDLLAGRIVPEEGNYNLISWQSRLPPYTSFAHLVHFAPRCVDDHNPEKSVREKASETYIGGMIGHTKARGLREAMYVQELAVS